MEKWQELSLNFLFNVSVALVAGGVLKLVFDKGSVVPAFLVLVIGIYFAIFISLLARNIERKGG